LEFIIFSFWNNYSLKIQQARLEFWVGITMDFIISGIIAVGLLAYLAYAMFNPDKF
jgi:K+-transporting ATPase KdpF subunit